MCPNVNNLNIEMLIFKKILNRDSNYLSCLLNNKYTKQIKGVNESTNTYCERVIISFI